MASTTQGTMNDPKRGVAKVTCPTFEAMGQIPVFQRTYFLFRKLLVTHARAPIGRLPCTEGRAEGAPLQQCGFGGSTLGRFWNFICQTVHSG